MANTTVEAFSISHAAILNGTTGAEETLGDIYGVREGSLTVDTGEYDNTGDDAVLSTWYWLNFATVTIVAGYIPFGLISLLSGASLTSSGAAPNDYYFLPLWERQGLNQPPRPMVIRCPSKDSAGNTRNLDIVLYKVQFTPINFSGPVYKDGLLVNYSGKALVSSLSETGAALAQPAVARLISKPAS